jgi:hypothetical protein
MTRQPGIYIQETQAFGEELEFTLLLDEDEIKSSSQITMFLSEKQIRQLSEDIIKELEYHLSIMDRIPPSNKGR